MNLSEEPSSPAAFVAVKVDVDVVILAINRFLYIWLFEDFAVYGKRIVVQHFYSWDRKVLIQVNSQL